jgi:hypothetical protein
MGFSTTTVWLSKRGLDCRIIRSYEYLLEIIYYNNKPMACIMNKKKSRAYWCSRRYRSGAGCFIRSLCRNRRPSIGHLQGQRSTSQENIKEISSKQNGKMKKIHIIFSIFPVMLISSISNNLLETHTNISNM